MIKSHYMTEHWGVARLLLATGSDNTMPTNIDAQYIPIEHRVTTINWKLNHQQYRHGPINIAFVIYTSCLSSVIVFEYTEKGNILWLYLSL